MKQPIINFLVHALNSIWEDYRGKPDTSTLSVSVKGEIMYVKCKPLWGTWPYKSAFKNQWRALDWLCGWLWAWEILNFFHHIKDWFRRIESLKLSVLNKMIIRYLNNFTYKIIMRMFFFNEYLIPYRKVSFQSGWKFLGPQSTKKKLI